MQELFMRYVYARALASLACLLVCVTGTPQSVLGQGTGPIRVTPGDGGTVYARPSSDRNAVVFRVYNDGTAPADLSLTCAAAGSASTCRLDTAAITVQPGRWLRVPVRYQAGASGT